VSGQAIVYLFGKDRLAARVVWAAHHGAIPPGAIVRHRCDNGRCIRVDHLELGTPALNVGDRVIRGRSATGIRNGRAKWTDAEVAAMRARRKRGDTLESIANDYGAHPATMSRIVRGLRR
jgi:hypothetical protein